MYIWKDESAMYILRTHRIRSKVHWRWENGGIVNEIILHTLLGRTEYITRLILYYMCIVKLCQACANIWYKVQTKVGCVTYSYCLKIELFVQFSSRPCRVRISWIRLQLSLKLCELTQNIYVSKAVIKIRYQYFIDVSFDRYFLDSSFTLNLEQQFFDHFYLCSLQHK